MIKIKTAPKMKNKQLVLVIIFLIAAFTYSCDRNKVYEDYIELDEIVWENSNKLGFKFEIDDTVSLHNVYINVRHASLYPYNNVWVFIKSSAPNGTVNIDTVECLLADADGRWIGEGMGDIWDVQIPWKQNVRFPHKGVYQVEFQQGMRVDKLPGIMGMGLRVEKAEK